MNITNVEKNERRENQKTRIEMTLKFVKKDCTKTNF